jgi:hypothetical protein
MADINPTHLRILAYLNAHSEGVDDDALAAALGMKRRQQANVECRRLAEQNLIDRRQVDGKIRNFATGVTLPVPKAVDTAERPWFWEGHVQDRVVQFLRQQGFDILHTADPGRSR